MIRLVVCLVGGKCGVRDVSNGTRNDFTYGGILFFLFGKKSHFKKGPFFVSEQTTATGVLPVLVIKADNSLGTSP